MLDLSRAMREAGTDTLSPGTWIAQLRQLQSGVTQLITSIVNAQIDPEPRLELLSQTLDGRFSLAMQQALAATERSGSTGSLELFAELGVEGAAIDRLASGLGDSEAETIAALRTDNAQRSRTIRTERRPTWRGRQAYTQYDALTSDLMDGIDEQLATSADDARRSALISGGTPAGRPARHHLAGVPRLPAAAEPDPQGARGRPRRRPRAAPRGGRPHPRRSTTPDRSRRST